MVMAQTPKLSDRTRHAEFAELLGKHQSHLFSYIFSLLHNRHDTEDLFQQASLIWWAKFDEFQPGTNFAAWACRIAQFELLKFYKRKNRTQVLWGAELQAQLADVAANSSARPMGDRIDALGYCIARLSAADRALLGEVYEEELSMGEVAARRGRPLRSIYNSLGRIRDMLHECIRRRLMQGGA